MGLFDKYANEADFRTQFVRPLLNMMGFYLVTETHGSRQFGMDFVFSELHRFGGMRYYAAQVKHEKTIRSRSPLGEAQPGITGPGVSLPAYAGDVARFRSSFTTPNAQSLTMKSLGARPFPWWSVRMVRPDRRWQTSSYTPALSDGY